MIDRLPRAGSPWHRRCFESLCCTRRATLTTPASRGNAGASATAALQNAGDIRARTCQDEKGRTRLRPRSRTRPPAQQRLPRCRKPHRFQMRHRRRVAEVAESAMQREAADSRRLGDVAQGDFVADMRADEVLGAPDEAWHRQLGRPIQSVAIRMINRTEKENKARGIWRSRAGPGGAGIAAFRRLGRKWHNARDGRRRCQKTSP